MGLRCAFAVCVIAALLLVVSMVAAEGPRETDATASCPPAAVRPGFGGLPLLLVESGGQADPRVAFYARGRDMDVVLTAEGVA